MWVVGVLLLVHEIGYSECPKAYCFRGDVESTAEKVRVRHAVLKPECSFDLAPTSQGQPSIADPLQDACFCKQSTEFGTCFFNSSDFVSVYDHANCCLSMRKYACDEYQELSFKPMGTSCDGGRQPSPHAVGAQKLSSMRLTAESTVYTLMMILVS